jgi:hypothetical protein
MQYRLRAVDSLLCSWKRNSRQGRVARDGKQKLIKRIYASWVRKESVSFSENFFAVD